MGDDVRDNKLTTRDIQYFSGLPKEDLKFLLAQEETDASVLSKEKLKYVERSFTPGELSHGLGRSLDEAKRTICGERQDSYGSPENSFKIIADFWTTYMKGRMTDVDAPLTALDVSNMMILFKTARCLGQKPCRDNYIDIQGYAAICADRLMEAGE